MADRTDLERKGWYRPTWLRATLAVLGAAVILVGMLAWALETEYGGWEGTELGEHVVGYDEATGHAVVYAGEQGEILYEADSLAEVDAWIEAQRTRDYTVSVVVIAVGAILVVAGLVPSPAQRPESEG